MRILELEISPAKTPEIAEFGSKMSENLYPLQLDTSALVMTD
jgi:hypothetical protein